MKVFSDVAASLMGETGPVFPTWFFAAGALVVVTNLVPRGLVLGLHNARRIGQR